MIEWGCVPLTLGLGAFPWSDVFRGSLSKGHMPLVCLCKVQAARWCVILVGRHFQVAPLLLWLKAMWRLLKCHMGTGCVLSGNPISPWRASGCPDLSGSVPCAALHQEELEALFLPYDLKRLEMYSRNMVDYHLIMDMIPAISRMYFLNQLGDLALSAAQSVSYLLLVCQKRS